MFGFGKTPREPDWKTVRKGGRPPFITSQELTRSTMWVVLLLTVLFGFIYFARDMIPTPGESPADHDAMVLPEPIDTGKPEAIGAARPEDRGSSGPVAAGDSEERPADAPALDPEVLKRLEAFRAEWERMRREQGLPVDAEAQDYETAFLKVGGTRLLPVDHGLLYHVTDGTDERERAPYHHLLRYVMARTQDQLRAEIDPNASFDWLRLPPGKLHEKLEAARALRGTVVSVRGILLDLIMCEIDDQRSPRPFVWQAILDDKDRNKIMVVAADKDVELFKDRDIVEAVGPFFKLLRVETQDKNTARRYKGFPLVVVRSLQRVEIKPVRPGLISNALVPIVVVALAIVVGIMGVQLFRSARETPRPPPRRSSLDNQRLRALDRTKPPSSSSASDDPPSPEVREAAPPGTVSADTVPADTVPADTVPADTVPADTVPADTVPADTVPATTTPGDTASADTARTEGQFQGPGGPEAGSPPADDAEPQERGGG
ncbi:hypothetical protein ACFL59_06025 [Planctomycetota bacterium]